MEANFDLSKNFVIEEKRVFDRLGIWDKLYKIKENKIYFQTGSYIILEYTNCFCTIDINSGDNFKTSAKDLNLRACEEIAYLIKLLGIGGKIIIDFLPTSLNARDEILVSFRKFFREDNAKITLWGWTNSGAFEIERERTKTPINLILDD